MGRLPKPARQDSEALSLHSTPVDYSYADHAAPDLPYTDNDDLPPSYTDSEAAASSSTPDPRSFISQISLTNHAYITDEYQSEPTWTGWTARFEPLSKDSPTTIIRMSKKLDDPYHLYAYIMDVVRAIPPNPILQILGYHYETRRDNTKDGEKRTDRVTDFDIKASLRNVLGLAYQEGTWDDKVISANDVAYRGSFRQTRAPGRRQGVQLPESDESDPQLKDWCEEFCSSKALLKVFRVRKEARGFDREVLERLVMEMVRSTGYDGIVDVKFMTYDENVDIYNAHWINWIRTTWLARLFYFSMLWIITWPLLILFTKWYCVYTVIWNNSYWRTDQANRRMVLTYACMSETKWFSFHRNYLRHLVLQRHKGMVEADLRTIQDWSRNDSDSQQRFQSVQPTPHDSRRSRRSRRARRVQDLHDALVRPFS